MINDNSVKGLGLFCLGVLHLISIGKSEEIEEVETHFKEQNIIEYINDKYRDKFPINFNNEVYNNEVLNKYFYNYSSYIPGREMSKYGIENTNDGLLLIVALAQDIFERNAHNIFLTEE